MLKGIKNAKNIPAMTPTSVQRQQLTRLYNAAKAERMKGYGQVLANMRKNLENIARKRVQFTNNIGVKREMSKTNVNMYRRQAMEAAAQKAKKLPPIGKLPTKMPITSPALRAALAYYKKKPLNF